MNVKRVSLLILVLILAYVTMDYIRKSAISLEQGICQNSQEAEWTLNTSFGFPVWVALNSVPSNPLLDFRHVFLFIEAQNFNEENLEKVFEGLAAKYTHPDALYIDAFSDKKVLQQYIDGRKNRTTTIIEYPPEWYEKNTPPKTGYFRAFYSRGREGEESFRYSPDPEKEDFVTITLKNKIVSYTGNHASDLVLAAYEGDIAKVQDLLAQGADVNSRDTDGNTALTEATVASRNDVVKMLLTRGADVNATGEHDNTALLYAAGHGDKEIVQALLDRGADVNAQNKNGDTALIRAAYFGRADIVRVLLSKGANINERNKARRTALMTAAANSNVETVRVLLENGADVKAKDNEGQTASMLARGTGRAEIVQLLKKVGVKR